MRQSKTRLSILATAHAVFLVTTVVWGFGALDLPEEVFGDAMFAARGETPARGRVLIAAIDEASLEELGDWPWSRKQSARLISALSDLGAKAIYMDILYPDRSDAAADQALIRATRKAGNVVHLYIPEEAHRGLLQPPLPGLKQASALMADARIEPGLSGNIRCVRPFVGRGDPIPMGGVAAAALQTERPLLKLRNELPEEFCLNFRGAGAFPALSAVDIITGRLTPGQKGSVKGSVAFVGLTAATLAMDAYGTPFDSEAPGLEIHATLCDNVLGGDYLVRPPGWIPYAAFYVTALLTCLFFIRSPQAGALGGTGVFVVMLLACYASFQGGILPPLAGCGMAWLLSFLSGLILAVRR